VPDEPDEVGDVEAVPLDVVPDLPVPEDDPEEGDPPPDPGDASRAEVSALSS
jgi:hypothetical protein